jgi:hypothetical protein
LMARESVERDAAASAASDGAQRIHLELAEGYAALIRQAHDAMHDITIQVPTTSVSENRPRLHISQSV